MLRAAAHPAYLSELSCYAATRTTYADRSTTVLHHHRPPRQHPLRFAAFALSAAFVQPL